MMIKSIWLTDKIERVMVIKIIFISFIFHILLIVTLYRFIDLLKTTYLKIIAFFLYTKQ